MSKKASPLREIPLHLPGQSLDEAINRLWDDRGLSYFTYTIGFIGIVIMEWVRWFKPALTPPWLTTAIGLLVVAYCVRGVFRVRRQADLLTLGRDGERAVAEVLDDLRAQGCLVFHDIVGKGFNVDHVILSSHGIFVVETKTISKPPRDSRGATVKVEGRQITAGGANLGSQPLEQTEASARWIHNLLKQSTGRSFQVKPCLVFPGWFVEPMPKEWPREIWVLNPKNLAPFIKKEPGRLREEDLHLAAYHLSSYIRSPWAADDGRFAKAILNGRGRRHPEPQTAR